MIASAESCAAEHIERWLARAKCSRCRRGLTCYPQGHYPRRQYQLDTVADVAAAIAIGAESAAKAGARARASATSTRRWTAWVSQLALPEVLPAPAQMVDRDAPIGSGLSATESASGVRLRAAHVLAALEALGAALVRSGVELVSRTGLGRVLEWQHRVHGQVVGLVAGPRRLSPPMGLRATGPPR